MNQIYAIVAPSGTGKTTLAHQVIGTGLVREAVSITSRPQRPNEVNGINYTFETVETFEKMIADQKLAEWVEFGGNYYGLTRNEIEFQLKQGPVVIIVEPQGAEQLKQLYPERVKTVYLQPPLQAQLVERMRLRGDSLEQISRRQVDDQSIRAYEHQCDFRIPPGTPEQTYNNFVDIVTRCEFEETLR